MSEQAKHTVQHSIFVSVSIFKSSIFRVNLQPFTIIHNRNFGSCCLCSSSLFDVIILQRKMAPLASLFVLFLSYLCQSNALHVTPWTAEAKAVAFFPRGGGAIGFGRKGRKTLPNSKEAITDATKDVTSIPESEKDAMDVDETEDSAFDLQEVSKQLHREEVAEIQKSQQFLQKQQRRRELDKSWLDKGITGFIEFFENLFSWKVIEV